MYKFLSHFSNDLKEYLTEKAVDGKTVHTWYHRQFLEAAHDYYLGDTSHQISMHANLAQLFLQTDGVRRTITLTQRRGKVVLDADRRVAPQQLHVTNLRKLNALPHHLVRGRQLQTLVDSCLLDFNFVFTKLQAVGITALFGEFQDLLRITELSSNACVALMRDFLELNYDALRLDAHLFPFFLCESLKQHSQRPGYEPVARLVADATRWLRDTKQTLLLPTNPVNITPIDSPIKFSQLLGCVGDVSPNEEVVVCLWREVNSNKCRVNVFDLLNRDNIVSINIDKESPSVITPDRLPVSEFSTASTSRVISEAAMTISPLSVWVT